jgi:hypothetical protein
LTAVGAASGEVSRMYRNHENWALAALVCIALAFLCGLLISFKVLTQRQLTYGVVAGSVLLAVGLGAALFAEVFTLALVDRPDVVVATRVQGDTVTVQATVRVDLGAAHDQLVVAIFGLVDGHRTGALYRAQTGPNVNGALVQTPTVILSRPHYQGVFVYADVVTEKVVVVYADCQGNQLEIDGRSVKRGQVPVPVRSAGKDPLVGCAVVRFPVSK